MPQPYQFLVPELPVPGIYLGEDGRLAYHTSQPLAGLSYDHYRRLYSP